MHSENAPNYIFSMFEAFCEDIKLDKRNFDERYGKSFYEAMLLTLWWFQISPQVPGWSTSVTRLYSPEAWEVFQEILWQISGSHWEIPEVSQRNGEWFISRIIFIWHETGI